MTIAILYICTGNYTIFWNDFFESSEKYFFKDAIKHYFVFTDGEIQHCENIRVHKIQQANLGWPNNTLMRYHIFLKIEKQLSSFDYIYFFNANALFSAEINASFLPHDDKMLFVEHPGFYNSARSEFPYETNPKSKAYIPKTKGEKYICGGINGGPNQIYIAFMKDMIKAVDDDLALGLIAIWHDESHSNRYALEHPHVCFNPGYCYPERWGLPFELKILIRDKSIYGGHDFLRGIELSPTVPQSPVITSRICGDIGSQMFQYAIGRALALRLNGNLQLDISWFDNIKNQTLSMYQLEHFPIKADIITNKKINTFIKNQSFLQKILRKLHFFSSKPSTFVFKEPSYQYTQEFEKICDSVYLSGFWQSEKYFHDCAEIIRSDFSFPNLLCGMAVRIANQILSCKNATSIHIQREPYPYPSHSCVEYYTSALEQISASVNDLSLFVFSDDAEWTQKIFDPDLYTYTMINLNNIEQPVHSMHLMSLCKHHITSNSSLSWWAAWLAKQKGMTITPKYWFNDSIKKIDTSSPGSWYHI